MEIAPVNKTERTPGEQKPAFLSPHARTGGYSIRLDFFAGPMDLLLHLVRQQEVPIEQVEMRVVVEQYLNIILQAQTLDLDLASEYLVIAATLLDLKCQSILPALPLFGEEGEELEDQSPEFLEQLRERLRTYERTKLQAEELRKLPMLGVDTFVRSDRKALVPDAESIGDDSDPFELAKMFTRLMKRIGGAVQSFRIRLESVSVVSYMMKILAVVTPQASVPGSGENTRPHEAVSFFEMLAQFFHEPMQSQEKQRYARSHVRAVVVGGFIAALELTKRGLLQLRQEKDGADFHLQSVLVADATGENTSAAMLSSEFDDASAIESRGEQFGSEFQDSVIDIEQYRRAREERSGEREGLTDSSGEGHENDAREQKREANR